MKPRLNAPSEHDTQVTYFEWVNLMAQQDERYHLIFAVPNGGQRHRAVAAKLKAEGVRAGIPDIVISVPSVGYHGAYIENKSPGRKPTEKQWQYLMLLKKWGYRIAVCYSVEELIQFTLAHMAGRET